MKTMRVVLLVAALVAGTGAFAQRNNNDNSRQKEDKQKSEVRSENKRNATRRSEVNNARKHEVREIVFSDKKEGRSSENRGYRNGRDSENKEYAQRRESDNHRYNQDRDSRNRDRDNDRSYENRRNRNERYSIHHKRNDGYAHREYRDEACHLCYGPRLRRGFSIHYSVSDLARLETHRLAMALDLSNRQTDKIYRINLRYLSRRSDNHYYALERREKEIRKVLRWGQVQAYELYLRHMDDNDFCDNCQDGWDRGNFRIAFKINL